MNKEVGIILKNLNATTNRLKGTRSGIQKFEEKKKGPIGVLPRRLLAKKWVSAHLVEKKTTSRMGAEEGQVGEKK